MPDRDPLEQRFAAFRTASIQATTPPGVVAVARVVHRRRVTRAVVASVVAVGIVTGAYFGQSKAGGPVVPAITGVPVPPSHEPPSPSASASTVASPSHTVAATKTKGAVSCSASYVPTVTVGDYSVSPPDYFAKCPTAKVRVHGLSYEWSNDKRQYTLFHDDARTLTAQNPTTAALAQQLDTHSSSCGWIFVVLQTNGTPPAALPVSVTDAQDMQYFTDHKFGQPLYQWWNSSTSTQLQGVPLCQPSASPSAS